MKTVLIYSVPVEHENVTFGVAPKGHISSHPPFLSKISTEGSIVNVSNVLG